MSMSMDNAQIVDGCKRHNTKAQRALYDATSSLAMGICMRYARNRADAEDMLQEGYIRVFEKIHMLKESESLQAWVARIMVNNCIQTLRNTHRIVLTDEDEALGVSINYDPYALDDIVDALQQLPPQQRMVFNMCEVEGYSYEETAQRLHCSQVNVRSLLSRAKQMLREQLSKIKNR